MLPIARQATPMLPSSSSPVSRSIALLPQRQNALSSLVLPHVLERSVEGNFFEGRLVSWRQSCCIIMRRNGYSSLDDGHRTSKGCSSSSIDHMTMMSAAAPFVAFVLFVLLPDFYVKSASSQATLCACISLGLASRIALSSAPPCFIFVRRFAALAQFLCAVADVLSFSLSKIMPPIFLAKICTTIFCAAILAFSVASLCMQVDVMPSASFSAVFLECVRARPALALALIGVLVSAACISVQSSAALISCCCFGGMSCFLFGFPALVPPQSEVGTKDGAHFERAPPTKSWHLLSWGTAAFTMALLGYAVCAFYSPPWWMFPQEILLPLRWAGQGLWTAAASQLWRPSNSQIRLF